MLDGDTAIDYTLRLSHLPETIARLKLYLKLKLDYIRAQFIFSVLTTGYLRNKQRQSQAFHIETTRTRRKF